ncbi:MAG: N-acetylmuramoyl-L-alanine amidase, partial [Myxococcales bacterium]|nr:N-acetylmuramoyl-L-alanine amidase [Myxococcales bacterium]
MGELIVAGVPFHIDHPFVNFHEKYQWNAMTPGCVPMRPGESTGCTTFAAFSPTAKNHGANRYSWRPALRRYKDRGMPPLEAAQAAITQFVIHHDGLYNSELCWHVLHNERGLSCHFLIDNDGTIYQTLDLAFEAFHASEFNPMSIGVELCNRGDAKKEPNYYERVKGYISSLGPRPIKPCQVHGSKILAYDFTKQQYDALKELAKVLQRALPNLPIEYPQDAPGKQSWGLAPNVWSYAGYIGHYHLTTRKWDPGPFDFKKFCEDLRGSRCFPLWTGAKPDSPTAKPLVPEDLDLLDKRTEAFYTANEQRAEGGFFPVGPWGDSRLWHGGVHLPGDLKQPIFSPFAGRIVAARMGKDSAAGSCNFVLTRHDMSVGTSNARFYALYMHLWDELKDPAGGPEWMTKEPWLNASKGQHAKQGQVVVFDQPIESGTILGRMGKAGPITDDGDLSKPQLHFEIFAADELFADVEHNPWTVVDGYAGGRFSDLAEVNAAIDEDKDDKLSRRELLTFFSSAGERQGLRYLVTYNVSEWTDTPSWNDSLRTPKDFRALKPEEIDAMVVDQIEPMVWWTSDVADAIGLPSDGAVYHYHPITFVKWINQRIIETALDPTQAIVPVKAEDTAEVTNMTDDFGDEMKRGLDAISDRDLADD